MQNLFDLLPSGMRTQVDVGQAVPVLKRFRRLEVVPIVAVRRDRAPDAVRGPSETSSRAALARGTVLLMGWLDRSDLHGSIMRFPTRDSPVVR